MGPSFSSVNPIPNPSTRVPNSASRPISYRLFNMFSTFFTVCFVVWLSCSMFCLCCGRLALIVLVMWFKKNKEEPAPVVDSWPSDAWMLRARANHSWEYAPPGYSYSQEFYQFQVEYEEQVDYLPEKRVEDLTMFSAAANARVPVSVTEDALSMFNALQRVRLTIGELTPEERLAIGPEVVEKRYGQVLDVLKENHYRCLALVNYRELEAVEDSPDYAVLEAQVKAELASNIEKCEKVTRWLYGKDYEIKTLVAERKSSVDQIESYVEQKKVVQDLSVKVRKNLDTPSVSANTELW